MSDHLSVAEYHREQARAEVAKQGSFGISQSEYNVSRMRQMDQVRAAHAAERAHVEATGQEVRYTPLDKPVFTKRY